MPIHSGEQSLQSISMRGIKLCHLTFSLRVLPASNLTTFDAAILIFTDVQLILSVSIMMEYRFSNFPDHAGDHRDKHTPPPQKFRLKNLPLHRAGGRTRVSLPCVATWSCARLGSGKARLERRTIDAK